MRPSCFLGDSFDIVKQSLLRWLSACGPWSAHPMFTERVSSENAEVFSRLLGAPLSRGARLRNRGTDMTEFNPRIEISAKPWFGPRRRARRYLLARNHLLPPRAAWEGFAKLLGELANSVEAVRFIDFLHEKERFRYTIALIWTLPNSEARDRLYSLASDAVGATGWYPLPQGQRIGGRLARKSLWDSVLGQTRLPSLDFGGRLRAISSAVNPDGGCSIRIRTDDGCLLLDAGLPGHLRPSPSDRAIFVSHLHRDHFGGAEDESSGNIPVILPRRAAHMLLAQNRMPPHLIGSRLFVLSPEDGWQRLGNQLEIMAFQVPHAPGAVGYVLRDHDSAVFYTGDIVLRTARHDFLPRLQELIGLVGSDHITLLMDATMAARPAGASAIDAARGLLCELVTGDEVVIASRDSEQLLYAYLDLFHVVKEDASFRHRVDFLVTPKLLPAFRVIHAAFIGRELAALDPLLASQYGASMSAWAESKFLYWLHPSAVLPRGGDRRRIWFLTSSELERYPALSAVRLALIGGPGDKHLTGHAVLGLDTSPWTMHSNAEVLYKGLAGLAEEVRVVLFHDYPKRLQKFVRESGLSALVLTGEELRIDSSAV